jgi:NADPH:quinone reductase-like Zn-dependent oxidoreductase
MRAIVWTKYGPPEGLQLATVATPSPKSDELLVRIRATTVAAGDCELRRLHFSFGLRFLVRMLMGLSKPRRKILGQELAGDVVAVGAKVTQFRKGDPVFGTTGFGFGAYAEFICLPAQSKGGALARKPATMSYEEAAAVPTGGLEALHFLRKSGDLHGRRVLINGAGGGIGTFAVQLAKYFGADVTGVDSTGKLETIRSVGADRVVDYTVEDFTKGGETYDVIFDVVGASSFSGCIAALREGGHYLLGNPRLSTMVRGLWVSARGGKKVIFGAARQRAEDLEFLRELIEAGRIRSVIDRRFPLERIPEAHRYVESGVVRGKVVISVDSPRGGALDPAGGATPEGLTSA